MPALLLTPCLVLSTIAAHADDATATAVLEAPERDPAAARMLLSAQGPGEGEHAFGAALRIFIVELELTYAYGLTERITVEGGVALPFLGNGFASAYAGARVTAFDLGFAALALHGRAVAHVGVLASEGEIGSWILAHALGGALLTVGNDRHRVTIGGAVPWGYDTDFGWGRHFFEASLAYEVAAATDVNFVLGARLWVEYEGLDYPLPMVSVGGSF